MITEEMIREREFDKFVSEPIAIWIGYAKLDGKELLVAVEDWYASNRRSLQKRTCAGLCFSKGTIWGIAARTQINFSKYKFIKYH